MAEPEALVPRLIERATNSTAGEVDPRLLKAIKSAARDSENELRLAAHSLMDHMKKNHSQVRYLALLIIDELFMRSKLFRSLLVVNFDQFLSLSIGFRRNVPLPPPISIASRLRSKSIELLEKWNASFGIHYRQLRLGFDYLKNTLRLQFPNRLENAAWLQQERRERETRSKQILLNKFENLKDSYSSTKVEIQSTIDEIGECLDVLHAKDDESAYYISAEDDEVGEFESLTLRQIRLDSLKEGEKVQENSDNKAIFDALRELHKLLVSKHLTSVQEWISVLVRVDSTDKKFRDTALKEFIDIRNIIQSVKNRIAQLGFNLDDIPGKEDEEDLWVEGMIETHMSGSSNAPNNLVENSLKTQTVHEEKDSISTDDRKSLDDPSSSSTSQRLKLLAEAPRVTWGPFLDSWGANRDVLANQRGLELEGHWGRVDYDAVIPAEKIAELNVHRTVYKEQPVQIQPCRAPLKKGGLCQRRDLKVCPFHGIIVPRDQEGNLIEQISCGEGHTEEEASKLDTILVSDSVDEERNLNSPGKSVVEQLAKQAVKNVRERYKEVKSLKRAKLARVSEHNEAVLREAAITSTSYSETSMDHAPELYQHGANFKVKKPTLASMLRKKTTVKDRLAQRVLSSHATDASSRQLMEGEDAMYREAFSNQW